MTKLIVVSADGHTTMPPDLWPHYLETKYHRYLDRLRREDKLFSGSMKLLNDQMLTPETIRIFDKDGAYSSGGWQGLWDLKTRLREMDREGIAAEFVFHADFRAIDLFYGTENAPYPLALADAGVRAYNRWLHHTFGSAQDRLLLIGPAGTWIDIDGTIDEANWMADHGFAGVYTPGTCGYPGQPPLFDPHWDRLWAAYAERGLVMITHGGYALDQGYTNSEVETAAAVVKTAGGTDKDMIRELARVFNHDFFTDLRCRRSLWQLTLGGVFDRHPGLKMMMTEIRADWIPATLQLLDRLWEKHRDILPAKRPPSEYWRSNCMAGISFIHKCEVDMRHELGLQTVSFGRDYPHTESTWPNTLEYLHGLLRGVPENEVRSILGENIIRFLGLDRAKLAAIAERIGPTYEAIAGPGPEMDPALRAHLNMRCGYEDPAEGTTRVAETEALVKAELRRIAATAAAF
jgi:predicted TIM-barrel fold metal-dependent hydrolase